MSTAALIFANDYAEGDSDQTRVLLRVGGITLLERQLRQLKRAGLDHVLIISNHFPDLLHKYVLNFSNIPSRIDVLEQRHIDRATFREDERYLIVGEGVILAQSAVNHMTTLGQNAMMVLPKDIPIFGLAASPQILAPGGSKLSFASLATIDRGLLVQAIEDDSFQAKPLEMILTYMSNRQAGRITLTSPEPLGGGEPPIVWRPVTAKKQTGRVTRLLAHNQGNAQPDFITSFVHSHVENSLVSLLAWLKVPVTSVRFSSIIIGLMATWMIYLSALGLGLATAIVFSFVWGAGDKLGRIQLNSQFHTLLWRTIGWLIELGWFIALANMIAPLVGDLTPWVLMVTAWLFMLASEGALSAYETRTGQRLWLCSLEEKNIGLFMATRTLRLWLIIIIGAGFNWGYVPWGLAMYSALCFFIIQNRSNKKPPKD